MGGRAGKAIGFRSEKVRRFFERIHTEGAAWIERRTMPVYALNKKKIQQAHGTCVLLQVADTGFLLSASHVLRRRDTHTLVVHPWESHEALMLNGMTAHVSVDVKTVDVGFVRLPTEAFATLSKAKTFLRLGDLELGSQQPPAGWYSIFGYPGALFESDLDALEVTSTAFYYCNELREAPVREAVDGVTIAIKASTKNADADGRISELPVPEGISGCGMWRMHVKGHNADDWSVASIRLAGVQHGVARDDEDRPRIFVGTMVHNLVAAIWQQYPDMRAPIELHMPTLRSRLKHDVRRTRF